MARCGDLSGGISELVGVARAAVAVAGAAYAVKILDDAFDRPDPVPPARLAYALAALAAGAAADRALALAGFLASYAWGMASGTRGVEAADRLPTGLRGWAESLLALAVAAWAAGPAGAAAAVLAVGAVQLLDDLWDWPADRRAGARSLAQRWGRPGAVLAAAGFSACALALDPWVAAWLLAAGATASWVTREPSPGSARPEARRKGHARAERGTGLE